MGTSRYFSGFATNRDLGQLNGEKSDIRSLETHATIQKSEVEFVMGYWVDVIGFVLASDLLAASITGKFVSIGRGGGKATIPIKSFRLKLVLFLAACCLVGLGVWHLRSILGK